MMDALDFIFSARYFAGFITGCAICCAFVAYLVNYSDRRAL